MSRPCPFCAIVRGEAEAQIVYEDAVTLAFLDHRPLLPGHVLLIPRAHVQTIYEADEPTLEGLARASKRLATAVTAAMEAHGCFIAQNNIVSQSVPHLHIHVVPRRQGDGLFSPRVIWTRVRYGTGEMETAAAKIRAAVSSA
jgi:histidine triad (HIT) family protein